MPCGLYNEDNPLLFFFLIPVRVKSSKQSKETLKQT